MLCFLCFDFNNNVIYEVDKKIEIEKCLEVMYIV